MSSEEYAFRGLLNYVAPTDEEIQRDILRGFGKPEQNVDIRLQQQKLELLLQGGVGSMSDDDLGALAARWDEISQRMIEHDPSEIP
jgi:hypothetical protein